MGQPPQIGRPGTSGRRRRGRNPGDARPPGGPCMGGWSSGRRPRWSVARTSLGELGAALERAADGLAVVVPGLPARPGSARPAWCASSSPGSGAVRARRRLRPVAGEPPAVRAAHPGAAPAQRPRRRSEQQLRSERNAGAAPSCVPGWRPASGAPRSTADRPRRAARAVPVGARPAGPPGRRGPGRARRRGPALGRPARRLDLLRVPGHEPAARARARAAPTATTPCVRSPLPAGSPRSAGSTHDRIALDASTRRHRRLARGPARSVRLAPDVLDAIARPLGRQPAVRRAPPARRATRRARSPRHPARAARGRGSPRCPPTPGGCCVPPPWSVAPPPSPLLAGHRQQRSRTSRTSCDPLSPRTSSSCGPDDASASGTRPSARSCYAELLPGERARLHRVRRRGARRASRDAQVAGEAGAALAPRRRPGARRFSRRRSTRARRTTTAVRLRRRAGQLCPGPRARRLGAAGLRPECACSSVPPRRRSLAGDTAEAVRLIGEALERTDDRAVRAAMLERLGSFHYVAGDGTGPTGPSGRRWH